MIITQDLLKQFTGSDYYCGKAIHDRFAYKFFKKDVLPTGNIVAFVAPMEVTDNLIDLEDSINKDFIYSESAINFIIEIPDISLFAGVCFQRLFNAQVGSLLCAKYLELAGYVNGDDIMISTPEGDKKASVSIAAQKNNAVLIHLGININAGSRAPSFAYSTNLTQEKAEEFMKDCINMFYGLTRDIFIATTKVIV